MNTDSILLQSALLFNVVADLFKVQIVKQAKTRCYPTAGKHEMISLSKEPLLRSYR
jgi:hypothetical protein